MSPDALVWLAAPVAALAVACLALVPLGAQVLARGVVFIDLAVAQVAACGALTCALALDHPPAWATALAAGAAALAGAAAVRAIARRAPRQREALIGLVYVAGASIAVLAAAQAPHGRELLTALLAADVLWAPWPATALLAGAALLVSLAAGRLRRDAWFYPVFALALSAAVPALGLYLVFALLIAPALWLARGLRLVGAQALAALACALGLALSWARDWPSGACVALALCGLGLMALLRREGPA
ncbi:MAG: zinc/manganese transporter permease [Variovorax paradoxus]|nr:MAG: zinc/manganese transporter permease [Variovorax paradoxus]PZQ05056.1 MAG: zinc/manganese transporter permease [Variovorax paradoxus]